MRTAHPTVTRDNGYRLHFYSDETDRPHVHIKKDEHEVSVWIEPEIELKHVSAGTPRRMIRDAIRLTRKHRDKILAKWQKHFGTGGEPRRASYRYPGDPGRIRNITDTGLELVVDDTAYFISFVRYPDLLDAADLEELEDFRRESRDHFWWPALDVDISLQHLADPDPDRFLVSRRPRLDKNQPPPSKRFR